jgi:hypothetical protein
MREFNLRIHTSPTQVHDYAERLQGAGFAVSVRGTQHVHPIDRGMARSSARHARKFRLTQAKHCAKLLSCST